MDQYPKPTETIDNLYARLIDSEPKVVTSFTPSNAEEQRQAFLGGDIENTQHTNDRLESSQPTKKRTQKSREIAYTQTQRIFRGTNDTSNKDHERLAYEARSV